MAIHSPVLLIETVDLLAANQPRLMVDGTLGMGGHAEAMLDRAAAEGWPLRYLGVDQDGQALALAKDRLGKRAEYLHGNFAHLDFVLREAGIEGVDAILLDIGVSSFQIDTPERGFSFMENGPLDMRMDPEGPVTAADIVNTWAEYKLVDIFFRYGEERLARKIARAIAEDRQKNPFTETKQLADLLYRLYPPVLRHKKPHPATRVFQALRIEVNKELEVLEQGLAAALSVLAPGGVVAVITFHSLEDRIVKHTFREWAAADKGGLVNRKPILPSEEEIAENSRSRSAKLRAFQKSAF